MHYTPCVTFVRTPDTNSDNVLNDPCREVSFSLAPCRGSEHRVKYRSAPLHVLGIWWIQILAREHFNSVYPAQK